MKELLDFNENLSKPKFRYEHDVVPSSQLLRELLFLMKAYVKSK